jgi:hypothetical protein
LRTAQEPRRSLRFLIVQKPARSQRYFAFH